MNGSENDKLKIVIPGQTIAETSNGFMA